MNTNIDFLQPYPLERMNALKADVSGNPDYPHVALSIGEPKHPPPEEVVALLSQPQSLAADLGTYPATRGSDQLRSTIADWLARRFAAQFRPGDQILPVSGTREALFSFAQAVLSGKSDSLVLLPNPFYQIYEGAALLGGASPMFLNTTAANGYQPDFRAVPESVWRRCELLYVCSPGNPTGRLLPAEDMRWLLETAREFDFIIAADECYSELYLNEAQPPAGFAEVAASQGDSEYQQLVVFHSLSKRSNLPGLRSGFVAGDASILGRYFKYRTYQGCALPAHVQRASALAWSDEAHVRANRQLYRDKFSRITPLLSQVFSVTDPEGGFYHWIDVGEDDQQFALSAFRDINITVLPGSFISREADGINPGAGHIRVAWVAQSDQCLEAANRLVQWQQQRR